MVFSAQLIFNAQLAEWDDRIGRFWEREKLFPGPMPPTLTCWNPASNREIVFHMCRGMDERNGDPVVYTANHPTTDVALDLEFYKNPNPLKISRK